MKKKLLVIFSLMICAIFFTACGKNDLDLSKFLIEERQTLFTAQDSLYCVSFSSGKREANYALDGVVNEMVDFGILTIARLNSDPMANDTYNYTININEESYKGTLAKSQIDNSYATDIEILAPADATVSVHISFTGYTFESALENTSSQFQVDSNAALQIASAELKDGINGLAKDSKIEAVM
ncbi:MAG: hypothetical protein MJ152_01980, partial [Clostridia bacterium]|nr:hypothetical protein [Clostridia bacterium]